MNNARLAELVDAPDLSPDAERRKSSTLLPRTIVKYYGPYTRKDKRKHMVVFYSDGTRGSQSYPRYLMEQNLGRQLLEEETVDHKDDDETNDDLDNLQLLSLADNIRKQHAKFPALYPEYSCPKCNTKFNFYLKDAERLIRKKQAGPFCSKQCAGRYGTDVQNGRI